MNLWNILRQYLGRPEYVHVLLNPLPVYGLALALVALIIALVLRNRVAIVIGLALVVLTSLSAWPTYAYGEAGYDRVKATSDKVSEQWLDEHMSRGERFIMAYYILAGLVLALVIPVKWPRSLLPLASATFVIGLGTLVIGGWVAYAGGHVRHREFRFESSPPVRTRDP